MSKILVLLTIFTAFLFFCRPVFAASPGDVLINEFSPKSDPEWVELYNPKDSQISIAGWTIKDAANHTETVAEVCILPHGFYTFQRSGGWLNNDGGDSISLLDDSGTVIDNISYGTSNDPVITPASDQSASRVLDGSSNWQIGSPTKQDTSISCPLPTPTPTSTPSPTATPTPSTSSTSTAKSPTPTPKPSTKPTTVKPSSSPHASSSAVLGEDTSSSLSSEFLSSPSPSPSSFQSAPSKIASILIGSGFVLMALAVGFYLYHQKVLNSSGIRKENERFEDQDSQDRVQP